MLHRTITRASDHGYGIMAAFENEFYLLRRDDNGQVVPADETVFSQTSALDRANSVIAGITAALTDQGLLPEMLYSESGPGQFEMPTRYADALAAADNQIVFRETIRAVAYQHELVASFLPKIFEDKAGSGAHLHLSLWREGANLTSDAARFDTISQESSMFAAGILHHLPALMAITTPSPISYRRIRPHFWSGAFTCWGYGNREAAIRVPQLPAGRALTNLELKTCDPTCNPYLALGATIAAGLDGLNKEMELGDPVQMDPANMPEEEREVRGIRRLPKDLGAAIAEFEADEVLQEALGPELTRSFLAVRRDEWEALKDLSLEEQVDLLLERY